MNRFRLIVIQKGSKRSDLELHSAFSGVLLCYNSIGNIMIWLLINLVMGANINEYSFLGFFSCKIKDNPKIIIHIKTPQTF